VIPLGVIETLIQMLYVLYQLDDMAYLGPNIAVAMITILYALIIYVVVRLIRFRKEG